MGYFQVTEPLGGVYRLCGEGVNYATLVCGRDGALLFDTGLGLGDIRREAEELTRLPLTVVNSHEHADHIGGNAFFPEVWMTAQCRRALTEATLREIRERVLAAQRSLPPELEREEYLSRGCGRARRLMPGQVFDLGGRTLHVVPLPSHTAGSVGLFCPALELLLSADSVAPMVSLIWPDSLTSEGHLHMLEGLEGLRFRHMLCSHSAELMPKEALKLFRESARTLRQQDDFPYRESFYPEASGRMCLYNGEEGAAILIVKEEELEDD